VSRFACYRVGLKGLHTVLDSSWVGLPCTAKHLRPGGKTHSPPGRHIPSPGGHTTPFWAVMESGLSLQCSLACRTTLSSCSRGSLRGVSVQISLFIRTPVLTDEGPAVTASELITLIHSEITLEMLGVRRMGHWSTHNTH
jgi:hypothetical protein